jgi:hypothetical protein
MKKLLVCLVFGLSLIACKGGGSDGSGGGKNDAPITPTSPSSGTDGPWTGTLTRPNGNAAMTVSWQASQNGQFLTGPMTLTVNGRSAVVTGSGEVAGNQGSGYTIFMSLRATAGQVPGLPNCSIIGGTLARPGVSIPAPFRTIASAPVTMNYTDCQGFMDPPPQRTNVEESGQLTLTKQ